MSDGTCDIQIQDRAEVREVGYTPESVRNVVIAVAHLLNHFADPDHEGLREPHNVRRRVHGTSVLVHPRQGGLRNLVGFQLFVTDPDESIVHEGRSNTVGVVFSMEAYEKHGDKYLFNMLKAVTSNIREATRPSASRLEELSKQYLLAN